MGAKQGRNRMAGSRARPPIGANPADRQSEPSRKEAAEYIASLLEGLRHLANQTQMPFLAYLLAMAQEEANTERAKPD